MWRDVRSPRVIARAVLDLLLLELRVITGNRLMLLVLGQLAWLAGLAIWQHFRDEPWNPVSFYNRTVLMPSLLPAIALGMNAVMGERDNRHLEMTFASPGGRYQAWAFRLCALAMLGLMSCTLLAFGTWAVTGQGFPPVQAALHALVPVLFVTSLAVCLSLLFNGAASGGLVVAALAILSGTILHHVEPARRFDLFLNPFDPPASLDALAWFRIVVANRCILLVGTGLATWGALDLLQRRERLT
jgi:ABC-type transport system involved in multi-copper enzyme maturation permease subunit